METIFDLPSKEEKGGAVWSIMCRLRKGTSKEQLLNDITDEYPQFSAEELIGRAEENIQKGLKLYEKVKENEQTRLRVSTDSEVIEVKDRTGKIVAKLQLYKNDQKLSDLVSEINDLKKRLVAAEAEVEKFNQIKTLMKS